MTDGMTGAATEGLRTDIDSYLDRAIQLLARERRIAAAELLTTARQTNTAKPVVFVVGEAKRGKSMLVSALLERRDASPSGIDLITAVPVRFSHGELESSTVFYAGDSQGETTSIANGQACATVAGAQLESRIVTGVTMEISSECLLNFDLVDTPGVGGLDAGHAKITLQALPSADALLFVVDAGVPIGTGELNFLRKASARIATVIFVLNKIDTHRGWRVVLEDNRRIVAKHAPRFAGAPWFATSASLAVEALGEPDADEALALRQEGAVDTLRLALDARVSGRTEIVRAANLIQASQVPLANLQAALKQRRGSNTDTQDTLARIVSERSRLQQLNHDRADWMQLVDAEFRKLALERSAIANARTIDIRRRFEERLQKLTKPEQDTLAGELIAELIALAGEINETTMDRIDVLVASLFRDIDTPGALLETIEAFATSKLADDLATLELGHRSLTHLDRLSIFSTFSSGRSMTSLVSGSGLGVTMSAVVAAPIGLAVGLGLGGFFAYQSFRNRSRELFSSEFIAWMRDQIARSQLEFNNSFARDSIELQGSIRRALRDAMNEREQELSEALRDAQADHELAAGRRKMLFDRIGTALEEIRALRRQAVELLQILDGAT